MSTSSHKQRLRAAMAGEPTDRVPRSHWWHDFGREWSAEGLAEATIEPIADHASLVNRVQWEAAAGQERPQTVQGREYCRAVVRDRR
jgi:hypothetical protein